MFISLQRKIQLLTYNGDHAVIYVKRQEHRDKSKFVLYTMRIDSELLNTNENDQSNLNQGVNITLMFGWTRII